jgi:tetratricopeptide (TPR) repeat protein
MTISKSTISKSTISRTLRLSLLTHSMRLPILAMLALLTVAAPSLGATQKDRDDCIADDPARTIAGCTRIVEDLSESAKIRALAHVSRGLAYLGQNDLDSAITNFTDAIRLDPKNANAYDNRGQAFTGKGDYDHAIADFDQAVNLDPSDASALNRRGIAWGGKGEVDRAIADFSRAIAVAPRFAGPFFNRALTRQGQGLLDLALADLAEALRLEPSLARAHSARAEIFMAKHDPDAAIAELDAMIALDPDSPVFFYYMRGVARYDRYMSASALIDPEDLKRAIADFSKAIEKGPYYTEAYRARAMAEETDGQHELAAADLAKAEGREPIRFRLRDELQ